MSLLSFRPPLPHLHFSPNPNPNPNPDPNPPSISLSTPTTPFRQTRHPTTSPTLHCTSSSQNPILSSPTPIRQTSLLLHIAAASSLFFIGFRSRAFAADLPPILPSPLPTISENEAAVSSNVDGGAPEDEELRAAFESWKSKTFALTVPLRIVAHRGSMPPSWIKDFIEVQGRRVKLNFELSATLESIFSGLSSASDKKLLAPRSPMAADLVSVGDSWLSSAISKGLIEPVKNVQEQDWFKVLSNKWKVYLCRNQKGELDSNGYIWGAPYRWGTMVIAYKKNKFAQHKLKPIEDWGDLWRPELAGKISMIDCPREVVGSVLKHMGASYNTMDIDSQVVGGREAVLHNLAMLQKQVRLFDSVHYLKAFGAGDVWVAVGWSSDVLPVARRSSNVAVIVPKSGASLWADLWAIPATTGFTSDRVGGRIRSPSPLIHQWIEFCLQTARELSFQGQFIPGASPFSLEHLPIEGATESTKGKPRLDTNLTEGVPPPDILSRCEFLEPLSEKAQEDYQWLISNMQKPSRGWIENILHHISFVIHTNLLLSKSR